MPKRRIFTIPRDYSKDSNDALRRAASRVIAEQGTVVSWPDLDADFTIMSLLHGVYGGKRWMSELARRGGEAKSKAKARAARINGAKGGRPQKTVAHGRNRRG